MNIQAPLTTEKAAEIIGVHKRTLDNWRFDKKGPKYIRVSKRMVRYRLEDLQAFLEEKLITPVNK